MNILNKILRLAHNIFMLTHFILYGFLGILIEVFWTGLWSLLSGDLSLTGHTYIWMFFIYGLAVFLEPIHDKIRSENLFIRGFIWVFLIYFVEFISGFLLDKLIGACPWDYRKSTRYTLFGYIRIDYLPAWFVGGLFFEKFHDFLDKRKLNLFK